MSMNKKYVCVPALVKKGYDELFCPYETYVALLCEIPYGQVATEKALSQCLERIYGYKNLQIDYSPLTSNDMMNLLYPFWRLVSERGHLLGWKEKDLQKQQLLAEGHVIDQPKPEQDGLVVRDYKTKLYDFSNLHITVRTDISDCLRLYNALKGVKE